MRLFIEQNLFTQLEWKVSWTIKFQSILTFNLLHHFLSLLYLDREQLGNCIKFPIYTVRAFTYFFDLAGRVRWGPFPERNASRLLEHGQIAVAFPRFHFFYNVSWHFRKIHVYVLHSWEITCVDVSIEIPSLRTLREELWQLEGRCLSSFTKRNT